MLRSATLVMIMRAMVRTLTSMRTMSTATSTTRRTVVRVSMSGTMSSVSPGTPELSLERIKVGGRTSTFGEGRGALVVLETGDKVPEVVGLVHVSSVRHC